MVKEAVVNFAKSILKEAAHSKPSFKYLSKNFVYGEFHPLIDIVDNSRQVTRVNTKTRIVCGVYPLNNLNTCIYIR